MSQNQDPERREAPQPEPRRSIRQRSFLRLKRRQRRRAPLGAPPGTLAVAVDAPAPRIHVMRYGAAGLEERDVSRAGELAAITATPGQVTWVDVQGLGDGSLIREIGDRLGIHPLAVADAVNVPQRPKTDFFDDHLLVVAHMAQLQETAELAFEQVGFVLGHSFLVTFQERPGDVFDPVRNRIRTATSRVRSQGADYLLFALLDALIDAYFPVLESVGATIERLEEDAMERPTPETLAAIHSTRRTLLYLHRIQWRQRDAVGALLRAEDDLIGSGVRVYLRDAHDHAFQTLDVIETYRDLVVGLLDIFLSSASNRMNEVMKTLTVVATIFIPLTFIAGVYGMNFKDMPELHWRWGYPAVWATMAAVAFGLIGWFRTRGWLGTQGAGRRGEGRDGEP